VLQTAYTQLHADISSLVLYADKRSDNLTVTKVGSSPASQMMSMADHFKSTFSHKDVKVHFVGAWYVKPVWSFWMPVSSCQDFSDTVSSIGIARGEYMLLQTIEGMKHVCYFCRALALDEQHEVPSRIPLWRNGHATHPVWPNGG
jgi:hypothetical protein